MTILYEDSLYPGKIKGYRDKTIGQILATHRSPSHFVKCFNSKHNNICISDEVMVDYRGSNQMLKT